MGTHACSVSSSGIGSSQGADITAESATMPAKAAIGAHASAYSPIHLAVTSGDIQEERALKECTFAPRLNPNKGARSIVAQTWKDLPVVFCQREQHTAAVPDKSHAVGAECLNGASAGAEDDSPTTASAASGGGDESPDAASAATVYAGGDKGDVLCGTHNSGQNGEHQPASAVSTRSRLRRGHRNRQLGNSYAASAQRSKKSSTAVACSAVPADALRQQQHAAMYDTLASMEECAEVEAQLQAEVAGCDKRLEQCRAARRKHHVVQKAVSNCPHGVGACGGAGRQVDCLSNHMSIAQLQQSALKIAIEAELADGSASRFEVQQVSS